MVVFQVSSRGVQRPEPTRKRARRFPAEWYVVARVVGSGFIGGAFFTLLVQFGHSTVFIVLPVLASLSWAQPQRYNISTFLTSTPIYLLLTSCLAFLYLRFPPAGGWPGGDHDRRCQREGSASRPGDDDGPHHAARSSAGNARPR